MFYSTLEQDIIHSDPVATPFSFHYGEDVLVGRCLFKEGLSVYCPNKGTKAFHYSRQQKLKDCYIQVDGVTVYICSLVVSQLQEVGSEYVYRLKIKSILPAEKEKLLHLYEKKSVDPEACSAS